MALFGKKGLRLRQRYSNFTRNKSTGMLGQDLRDIKAMILLEMRRLKKRKQLDDAGLEQLKALRKMETEDLANINQLTEVTNPAQVRAVKQEIEQEMHDVNATEVLEEKEEKIDILMIQILGEMERLLEEDPYQNMLRILQLVQKYDWYEKQLINIRNIAESKFERLKVSGQRRIETAKVQAKTSKKTGKLELKRAVSESKELHRAEVQAKVAVAQDKTENQVHLSARIKRLGGDLIGMISGTARGTGKAAEGIGEGAGDVGRGTGKAAIGLGEAVKGTGEGGGAAVSGAGHFVKKLLGAL